MFKIYPVVPLALFPNQSKCKAENVNLCLKRKAFKNLFAQLNRIIVLFAMHWSTLEHVCIPLLFFVGEVLPYDHLGLHATRPAKFVRTHNIYINIQTFT